LALLPDPVNSFLFFDYFFQDHLFSEYERTEVVQHCQGGFDLSCEGVRSGEFLYLDYRFIAFTGDLVHPDYLCFVTGGFSVLQNNQGSSLDDYISHYQGALDFFRATSLHESLTLAASLTGARDVGYLPVEHQDPHQL